ncbi:MAG: hypothetical protein AAF074_19485 [Pseudomonadota bacterium]
MLFRAAAVLWVIWGAVHVFAGAITLYQISADDVAGAVGGIASLVPPETLQIAYPEAVVALLWQHGWNLGWFGLVTLIGAAFVWRGHRFAIVMVSLVGGLADLGYFLAIDLAGLAGFPGPQMTWICAAAIALGIAGLLQQRRAAAA